MQSLRDILRTLTGLVSFFGFGLALIGALLAGVDPLYAILRATVCSVSLTGAFGLLTRVVPSLLGNDTKAKDQ